MSLLSMMRVTLHTVSANVRLTRTVLIIDYFWCRVVGPSVHASLDLYALIAVTPSSSTLDELINVVKADNDRRQQDADTSGDLLPRKLDVSVPLFECRGTVFTATSSRCHVLPTRNSNMLHSIPNIFLPSSPSTISNHAATKSMLG